MTKSTQHLVLSELRRARLPESPQLADRLTDYVELLQRWGRRVNLTGKPEVGAICQRLLPDSLVLARELSPPAELVDVGSGSGIVGLVLAVLWPQTRVLLVEPLSRRCSFLRTAAHQLRLDNVTVHEARLDQLQLAPVPLATSRATWAPEQWLSLAQPLLAPRGMAVVFLSQAAAPQAVDRLTLERQVCFELADGTLRGQAYYRI